MKKSKALEFIYNETIIHFLINPDDKNVMVNATEMAKIFGKRIDRFLRTDSTKLFISALLYDLNSSNLGTEFTPKRVNSEKYTRSDIIKTKGHLGTYFNRILALKFAAWLDPYFEVWVYSTIEEITFGNYKKHWEAHAAQEAARLQMNELEFKLKKEGGKENAIAYFDAKERFQNAKNTKTKAIRNQLKLFQLK